MLQSLDTAQRIQAGRSAEHGGFHKTSDLDDDDDDDDDVVDDDDNDDDDDDAVIGRKHGIGLAQHWFPRGCLNVLEGADFDGSIMTKVILLERGCQKEPGSMALCRNH